MHSWIDGPYGGGGRRIENEYDTMILIAGGSGITSCLPWLQYLSQIMDDCTIRMANVKLLWVMRDAASLGWISQELEELSQFASQGRVTMEFFVTGQHQPGEKLPLKIRKREGDEGDETPDDEIRKSQTITGSGLWHFGRPDLIDWVPKLLMPGRNLIIGKLVEFVYVAVLADIMKDVGLKASKTISLRQALSPKEWFSGTRSGKLRYQRRNLDGDRMIGPPARQEQKSASVMP